MKSAKQRPLWRLEDLIVQCFRPEELHRLLMRWFPALEPEIPPLQDSPAQFAHLIVTLLDHHGLVEVALFSCLLQARPLRRSQILSVCEALSVATDAAEAAVDEPEVTRVFRAAYMVEPVLIDELERLLLDRERCGPEDPQHTARSEDIERIAAQVRTRRTPRAGTRVAGTILEYPIGSGTFGKVWRARNAETNAPLATKLFDLNRLTEGVMLWRFRRSIRALQTLNKYAGAPASIARVATVSADGLAFSMELCTQESLVTIARRNWTLDTKIRLFSELCHAVAFAHRAGVIHRDIKPANVLLDADLRPVLIDFDVADIHFLTQHNLTVGGLGTPMFAAPEQLECAAEVDERADVYSLGRLLHFMLIERNLGLQVDQDALLANLWTFPPSLYAAVRRATQRDPRDRYPSVALLLRDVEAYKSGWSALKAKLRKSTHWVAHNAVLLMLATGVSLYGVKQYQLVAQQRETQRQQAESNIQLHEQVSQFVYLEGELRAAREDHKHVERDLALAQASLRAVGVKLRARKAPNLAALEEEKNHWDQEIPRLEKRLLAARQRLDHVCERLNQHSRQHRSPWDRLVLRYGDVSWSPPLSPLRLSSLAVDSTDTATNLGSPGHSDEDQAPQAEPGPDTESTKPAVTKKPTKKKQVKKRNRPKKKKKKDWKPYTWYPTH